MAKRIAIALVAVMGVWMLVQEIGAQYGWPPRYAILADFAALAGFIATLVATYRLWRLGQANGPSGRR
jgi:ABC-type phosphate transport system auxiliary subunit